MLFFGKLDVQAIVMACYCKLCLTAVFDIVFI